MARADRIRGGFTTDASNLNTPTLRGGAALLILGVATARLALVQPHVLEIGLFIAVVGQVIPYSFEQVALRTIFAGVFDALRRTASEIIG